MSTAVIAAGDDWEGIYVDGKLVAEDHSILLEDGMQLMINHSITKLERREVDLDWMADQGRLPQSLDDVVWQS